MQERRQITAADCRAISTSDNSANAAVAAVVSFAFILAVRIFANCFFYFYYCRTPKLYPQGSADAA